MGDLEGLRPIHGGEEEGDGHAAGELLQAGLYFLQEVAIAVLGNSQSQSATTAADYRTTFRNYIAGFHENFAFLGYRFIACGLFLFFIIATTTALAAIFAA